MIKTIKYDSANEWKNILVFGAIYGDETCWTVAIDKIINKIERHKIIIKTWSITFVPICNPAAFSSKQRYIEKNLNRVFDDCYNSCSYEEKLANSLTKLVDDCDILIDLHSIPSEWKPFVFQDYQNKEYDELAKIIWIKHIVKWWPAIYSESISSDTISYAYFKNKTWIVVEYGSNNNKKSIQTAKRSVLNVLSYYWVIDNEFYLNNNINQYNEIEAKWYYIKAMEWNFAKNWENLDKINKWELIATYINWEKIYANQDMYIILPYNNAKINNEWFLWWV